MRYYCDVDTIEFVELGFEMTRADLANIAIISDFVIIVIFIINICFLSRNIRDQRLKLD